MIKIVALLCSLAQPTNCDQYSSPPDFADMKACLARAPSAVVELQEDHPDHKVRDWKCVADKKAGEEI